MYWPDNSPDIFQSKKQNKPCWLKFKSELFKN